MHVDGGAPSLAGRLQPYTWRFSPPDADGKVTLKMTVGAKPVVVTKELVPKQA